MDYRKLHCYIDLHLHLDGSLSVHAVRELARQQGIECSMDDEQLKTILTVPKNCKDLNTYLTRFDFPLQLLQTEAALKYSTYDLLCRAKKTGIMYCEVRFAPQLHMQKGLNQKSIVQAVLDGMHKAEKECGIIAGIILCCMRGNDNNKANRETIQTACEFKGKGVCGVDLAGAEALYPTSEFTELFERARQEDLCITIHAGEAAGADSVRAAADMGAMRIGHGLHAIEDNRLLKDLSSKNITLELCPTSNLDTKAAKSFDEYPLMQFIEQGLRVTINTDNMTVSDTDICSEYELLSRYYDMDINFVRTLLYNAAAAAFTTKENKQKLYDAIDKELSC